MNEMERYSVITEKNPREIVLLRGAGCAWRRCRFCDYHLDCSPDQKANFALNRRVLARVTGEYHRLAPQPDPPAEIPPGHAGHCPEDQNRRGDF